MFGALAQGWFEGWLGRLPSQCAVCHRWPARPLCDPCIALFAQPVHRCTTCALPVPSGMPRCGACLRQPPATDLALAAVRYDYPWSAVVAAFKFQQQPGWARSLASLMQSMPWFDATLEAADMVLPMPLSPERLQERGFNQSALLARALARPKVHLGLLMKVKNTAPQSTLTRQQRLTSLRHAFALEPLQRHLVHGARVVLVDDVMTTGASLQGCAEVLRAAGARHISTLVFARTE